jgi:hypothetical protein
MQPSPTPPASTRLSRGQYDSFVVRVWSQSGSGLSHGHITHVGSRDTIAFREIDELVAFLLRHVGPPGPADHELSSARELT